MIVGNLNALPLAGLPPALRQILSLPQATLAALSGRPDGRWQPENCRWYCNIGEAHTQPTPSGTPNITISGPIFR